MKIIDDLSNMIMIGLIVFTILGVFIFVALLIYRKNNKASGIYEEEKDFSSFNRVDSETYLRFDDIKDRMIICDGGYRFVAAVRGYGFDFYHASAEVQAAVQQNFVGFINTITTPTMFRQYSKAIDVEHSMRLYEEAYRKKEMELFEIAEDIRNINLSMSDRVYNEGEKALFEKRLEELNRSKKAKEWQKEHLRDQMAKLKQSSGEHVDPERVQCWIFDWSYNPLDFTMDLTKEQIYEKALRQLESMANAKIHALQNCKVRAVRCSTEDLIEMTRRYSSPLSANRFHLRDVLKSSFFDDFNYETNHEEMMERARDSIKRSSSLDTLETFAEQSKKNRSLMPKGNLSQIGVGLYKKDEVTVNETEDVPVHEDIFDEALLRSDEMADTEYNVSNDPFEMIEGEDGSLILEEKEDILAQPTVQTEDFLQQKQTIVGESFAEDDDLEPSDPIDSSLEKKVVEAAQSDIADDADIDIETVDLQNKEQLDTLLKCPSVHSVMEPRVLKKQKEAEAKYMQEQKQPLLQHKERKRPVMPAGNEQKRAMMEQWLKENDIEKSLHQGI